MCISGLSKLIFYLLTERVSGENCHFRQRSTTSVKHFDLHDTHSLRHDAKNELKMVKFEPTPPNVSQHVATRWPNAQQCYDMLCWHVAIVWPGLK